MRFLLSILLLAVLSAICGYTQALPSTEVKRWSEDIDSYQRQWRRGISISTTRWAVQNSMQNCAN